MERYSYLWGTYGKDYCELGKSAGLDDMLRSLGAISPGLALDEVKRMLFGFAILPGYADQTTAPLAIRYAPIHLYKKQSYSLRNMKSFSAVCVNGLERLGAERESYYSHLTLMTQDDLLYDEEFSLMDQILGTHMLSAEEEEAYKQGKGGIDFEALPVKLETFRFDEKSAGNSLLVKNALSGQSEGQSAGAGRSETGSLAEDALVPNASEYETASEAAENLAAGTVWALGSKKKPAATGLEKLYEKAAVEAVSCLYQGPDHRVVIKLEQGPDFANHAIALVRMIYSLLPVRMQLETGFSIYEKPANMADMAQEVNIRLFLLPGECNTGVEKNLPDKSILIDMSDALEMEPVNLPALTEGTLESRLAESKSLEAEAARKQKDQELKVVGELKPDKDLKHAAEKWNALDMERRQQIMQVIYDPEGRYFDRQYYLDGVVEYFENDFFRWEKAPKTRLVSSERMEDQVAEVMALYKEYRRFTILRQLPELQPRFAAQVPDLLAEGHTMFTLKAAMVRYYVRTNKEEIRRKVLAYLKWLDELDKELPSKELLNLAKGIQEDCKARLEAENH